MRMLEREDSVKEQDPKPLVSVCISAYNVEQVVHAALTSVLNQTYKKIEVILIDNGSIDATCEVARSITDERIRCLRFPSNIGGYQAMNEAVRLATGDLIAVYHSDDIYESTIIEKEVAYLRSHPEAGAVFCLDHFMDYDGRIFGGADMPREFSGRELLDYEAVFSFILRQKNILFCCPTFMARRATFDTVGLFDPETYGIAADLEMWLRILGTFPVGILAERLMRYRIGRNQWSNRYNYLRTDPDAFFFLMDRQIEAAGGPQKLKPDDLVEYAFHRADDETFRAANLVIRGDLDGALKLLRRPYPWRTLTRNIRRRKLRVLLLRLLIRASLALGAQHTLERVLMKTEYGGPKFEKRTLSEKVTQG